MPAPPDPPSFKSRACAPRDPRSSALPYWDGIALLIARLDLPVWSIRPPLPCSLFRCAFRLPWRAVMASVLVDRFFGSRPVAILTW
ncbi:hypothetical protein AB1N83_007473 [Pleurotus pulmonarius]